jgi:hypothetical protein
MARKIVGLALLFAMLAPAPGFAQPPAPAAKETGHPYKRAGLIMIGAGALLSVGAMLGLAGIEGPGFVHCRADAVTRDVSNDCLDARAPNPSLVGIGVGLMGGGALIGLYRPPRTPQIQIGYRRLSVTGRVSF